MKKAFCEPGNISFCPPISLSTAFVFGLADISQGEFKISRLPENGGDVVFKNRAEIEAAFAQGEQVLHPGDLKGAVIPIMVSTLDKLSEAVKTDSEALQASKALKALAKKLAKNKGKK